MDKINIETTQNVDIHYKVAGIGDRIVATFIDMLVLIAYGMILFFIALALPSNFMHPAIAFIFFLPFFFYHLVSEIFMNGQTLGKQQRKIKVMRIDGRQATIGQYFIRWLLRPIDNLFYGIVAIITISSNGKGQRLGDLAAGTTVVKIKKEVTLEDVLAVPEQAYTERYQPVHSNVLQLSDKDIEIIRETLRTYKRNKNEELLQKVVLKTEEILQTQAGLDGVSFLEKIIEDYTYMAENA